ncbi:MAG: serine hydrolase domain-containing protein [Pseudomonadota bacterium]
MIRKSILLAGFVIGGLTACGQQSDERAGEAAQSASEPNIVTEETVKSPKKETLAAQIEALRADLEAGKYGLIDEVLLEHEGETVFHLTFEHDYDAIVKGRELQDQPFDYANPKWHPYYHDTDLHTLQSVTKSITSVLIGILETDGRLPNVADAKFLDFIDDVYEVPHRDENWEAMTIEDLLMMRANMDWNEDGDYDLNDTNDVVAIEQREDDWVQYILNKKLNGTPGMEGPWYYNSGASQLLSAVIQHVTGQTAEEFAKETLFTPMGITEYFWKSDRVGTTDTLGGLYLKSTDLIKFCKLMDSDGIWNGKPLLSEDYVNRSLKYWSRFTNNDTDKPNDVRADRSKKIWKGGYGYQWWLGDDTSPSDKTFGGSGYGGQYPICYPEKDTALVIYSWNQRDVLGMEELPTAHMAGWDVRERIRKEIFPLL